MKQGEQPKTNSLSIVSPPFFLSTIFYFIFVIMSFFLAKITITPIEVNNACLLDIKALKQDTHCIISATAMWIDSAVFIFTPERVNRSNE